MSGGSSIPRAHMHDPLAAEIRALVKRQSKNGWSAERIAHEMQLLGHQSWSRSVVDGVLRMNRGLAIDEGVAILAVFRAHAKILLREIDALTEQIERRAVKGGGDS